MKGRMDLRVTAGEATHDIRRRNETEAAGKGAR